MGCRSPEGPASATSASTTRWAPTAWPAAPRTTNGDPAPARRRRDAAVRGFAHWRAEVERLGGAQGLAPLHRAAARLVAEPAAGWRALVDADPAGDLERSRRLVELLAGHATDGWTTAVAASGVRSISLLPDSRRMGCCGTLGTVVP